jgi:hypothetical protein
MNSKQKIQACFQNIISYKKRNTPDQDFDEFVWHQFEKVNLIIYQENWNAMKRTHAALNYMWSDPTSPDKNFELTPEPIGQTIQTPSVTPILKDENMAGRGAVGAATRMDAETERKRNTIQGQVEAETEKAMEDNIDKKDQ